MTYYTTVLNWTKDIQVFDCGKSVINQFKFSTTVISVEENPWMGTLELQNPQ